jgi:hypothetical protein
MSPRDPKIYFTLTLEGVDGVNAIHQLRHLLKILLRSSGFRCVDLRQLDPLPMQEANKLAAQANAVVIVEETPR